MEEFLKRERSVERVALVVHTGVLEYTTLFPTNSVVIN